VRRAVAVVLFVAACICQNAAATIPVGNKIADLQIQSIGLQTPVFQGGHALLDGTLWPKELRHGPALYPGNAYPCTKGTVALAGHHLTNSHPFLNVSKLKPGQPVKLKTRYGSCVYHIVKVMTVNENAVWVLDWTGGRSRALVLTTCDQIYNSAGQQVGLLRTVVLAVGEDDQL
jgi:LPXTG-site transpeptidase (sortase) family protein